MSEVTSGVLVYMRHLREANICRSGMYEWFQQYGIDHRKLHKDRGLPVEELEATGDHFAILVANIARAEHGR